MASFAPLSVDFLIGDHFIVRYFPVQGDFDLLVGEKVLLENVFMENLQYFFSTAARELSEAHESIKALFPNA